MGTPDTEDEVGAERLLVYGGFGASRVLPFQPIAALTTIVGLYSGIELLHDQLLVVLVLKIRSSWLTSATAAVNWGLGSALEEYRLVILQYKVRRTSALCPSQY